MINTSLTRWNTWKNCTAIALDKVQRQRVIEMIEFQWLVKQDQHFQLVRLQPQQYQKSGRKGGFSLVPRSITIYEANCVPNHELVRRTSTV